MSDTGAVERAAVERAALATDEVRFAFVDGWTSRAPSSAVRDEAARRFDAWLAAAAPTGEQVAAVLAAHAARPAGSPHCLCGWRPSMYLNDSAADRGQHRDHQAERVVALWGGGERA